MPRHNSTVDPDQPVAFSISWDVAS